MYNFVKIPKFDRNNLKCGTEMKHKIEVICDD